MAWRWYRKIQLFGGLNANLSSSGLGWSWGFGFIRFGVTPNGRRWISFGIPGTGFRYFKYLKAAANQSDQEQQTEEEMPCEESRRQQGQIRKWKNLK